MAARTRGSRVTVGPTFVTVLLLASGCAGPTPDPDPTDTVSSVDADTAKRQMVEAVDGATELLGGAWHRRTGPDYAEACKQSDGGQGAQWRYLVSREPGGDPMTDADTMQERWAAQGMSVERWGSDDLPTVVGRGSDTISSISLTAQTATGYSIEAVSLCFPGDADDIAEDLADDAS